MMDGLLETITIDAGVAIGASGLLIAAVQIWLGRHRERLETTLDLIRQFQETDARRARYQARQLMETPDALEGRFEDLDQEARSILSSVAGKYGLAGVLMRRGKLDARLFLDMYGVSLIQNYERLGPYRDWRRQRYGTEEGSAWGQFEHAYRVAKRRLGSSRRRSGAASE